MLIAAGDRHGDLLAADVLPFRIQVDRDDRASGRSARDVQGEGRRAGPRAPFASRDAGVPALPMCYDIVGNLLGQMIQYLKCPNKYS